jgi:hypothetical protein
VDNDDLSEQQGLIEWYAVTHSEFYDNTIMLRAAVAFREASATCMSPEADEKKRLVAMGTAQAWAEVVAWKQKYEHAHEVMKAEQAAAMAPEREELVGNSASDQWYEKA